MFGLESDSHRGTFTTVTAEPATPMDVKVVTNVVLRPIMMRLARARGSMVTAHPNEHDDKPVTSVPGI